MLIPFSDCMQAYLAGCPAKLAYMGEAFKARMKRLRLRAGLKSQQQAAEAIGCERGTVGMWEAPSSAVDSVGSEYLLDVAAAYKVRPSYINTGEGDDGFPWTPDVTPGRHSQPLRLDPVMLAETHRALRKLEHGEGRTFSLEKEEDAVRFAQLYEMRAAMSAHPTQDEWVEFGQKLAAIKTPTGGGNGRGDGVPADGTSAKKVAR